MIERPRARARRQHRRRTAAVTAAVLGLAGAVAATSPPVADAEPAVAEPVTVIADGLNGPRQLSSGGGRLLVAESDTGLITAVGPHRAGTVVDGLAIPQGVAWTGGRVYIALGEAAPDSEPGAEPAMSGLAVARPGGTAQPFADLTQFELDNNPDGQIHFGENGEPLDAISNPYFVLRDKHGFLLVADAGANDVLKVDRDGDVSAFFVPPTVTTGVCATAPNNTVSGVGCDPVPTGLAYGPDGLLYISALTAEVEGEGRVYVVDRDGDLVDVLTGFTAPTGVAVAKDGTVYVSELLEGLLPDGPGPDFDPSEVGQIVKISPEGDRSYAQVTMPSGLLLQHGTLYSTAWAVAGFVGIPDAGQVVAVDDSAFVE